MALNVALVSPTQQVWSGEATFVSARTTEGDLGVLPGHAPLFGVLVDGAVSIKGTDGSTQEFQVRGGFLSVSNDRVSILTESVGSCGWRYPPHCSEVEIYLKFIDMFVSVLIVWSTLLSTKLVLPR